MKRSATIPTIVLTIGLATATVSAESPGKEPKKGSVVYVSRVLQSDSGQSHASKNAAHPAGAGLPVCEPVEVRAVHGIKSMKVMWKRDGQTLSTLGEHWEAVVHATREDCLKEVASLKESLKAH